MIHAALKRFPASITHGEGTFVLCVKRGRRSCWRGIRRRVPNLGNQVCAGLRPDGVLHAAVSSILRVRVSRFGVDHVESWVDRPIGIINGVILVHWFGEIVLDKYRGLHGFLFIVRTFLFL